jgi:hypothetical protein
MGPGNSGLGGKPSEKRACFTFLGKIQRGKQENLTKMMA